MFNKVFSIEMKIYIKYFRFHNVNDLSFDKISLLRKITKQEGFKSFTNFWQLNKPECFGNFRFIIKLKYKLTILTFTHLFYVNKFPYLDHCTFLSLFKMHYRYVYICIQ